MAIDTIYLVNHTHTDFGYTDYPETLYRQHRRIIDKAIDVCESNAHRPAGSQFSWTCEVAEITVDWFRHAPQGQIDRFMALHKAGLMAVAAMPMHWTPLVSPALAERSLDMLRTLRVDHGLTVRTAWQCDVNGLAWYWTDLLLNAGVERLVMASNPHRGMSDTLSPHLFDWTTPAGRTLPTLHGWHYSVGTNSLFLSDGDNDRSQVAFDRILARVEAGGLFPHRTALAQVTNVASPDNGFPTAMLPGVVERWNAEGRVPRLAIATLDQAMDHLMADAGPVPARAGDWPDYWADGVGSTAYETAVARSGERMIPVTDMLTALDGATPTGHAAQAQAAHDLMMYDEHTWGAYSSTSHAQSPFTRFQWSWKTHRAQQGFATAFEALTTAARLRAGILTGGRVEGDVEFRRATAPPTPVIDQTYYVFNPTAHPRRVHWPVAHDFGGAAPATLLHAWLTESFLPGMHIERFGTGQAPGHVIAVDLPAWGEAVVATTPVALPDLMRIGTGWIETDRWHLAIDPATGGIARLTDRITGRDWTPTDHPTGVLVHETLAHPERGRAALFGNGTGIYDWSRMESIQWPPEPTPFLRTTADRAEIGSARMTVMGPEIDAVLIFANGDRAVLTWRLPLGQGGIDLDVAIDKLAQTVPEAYYMVFSLPGAGPQVHLDIGDHAVAAEAQLPQGCATWTAVQRFASLATDQGALVVAAPDTPLVEPYGIQTEAGGGRRVHDPSLAFWVLNNHWDVNFAASQSGRIPARFRLMPQSRPDAAAARAFAMVATTPPVIVRTYDGHLAAPAPLFDLTGDPVDLRLRPAPGGVGMLLTLVNQGTGPAQVQVGLRGRAVARAVAVTAIDTIVGEAGITLADGRVSLTLGPKQTRYLRLE